MDVGIYLFFKHFPLSFLTNKDLAHLATILNKNEFGDNVQLPWTEVKLGKLRNSVSFNLFYALCICIKYTFLFAIVNLIHRIIGRSLIHLKGD